MLKTPLKDASYRKADFDPVTYKVMVQIIKVLVLYMLLLQMI